MKLVGPKRLIAIGGIAGAVAYWQVRARRRRQEELEWEAEVMGAIDEGRRAGDGAERSSIAESNGGDGEPTITISDPGGSAS